MVAGGESLHGARSVFNFEGRSVLLVSRRSFRIKLRMEETRDRGTLDARNPEIARAKDGGE